MMCLNAVLLGGVHSLGSGPAQSSLTSEQIVDENGSALRMGFHLRHSIMYCGFILLLATFVSFTLFFVW